MLRIFSIETIVGCMSRRRLRKIVAPPSFKGYFPGVGIIGSNIVFIENRNGNSVLHTMQDVDGRLQNTSRLGVDFILNAFLGLKSRETNELCFS